MVSDRMIQAIGTLERAVSRLEQGVAAVPDGSSGLGVDASGARAALKSLDDLITELKGRTGG